MLLHEDNDNSLMSDVDAMRQRFSMTVHPRFPIILCSDGYMVTVVQLPGQSSCLSIIKGLVSESDRHMRRIRDKQNMQLNLFESLRSQGNTLDKNKKGPQVSFRVSGSHLREDGSVGTGFHFEVAPNENLLNETQESDIADFGSSQNLGGDMNASFGKIIFGDMENLNSTRDVERFLAEDLTSAQHMIETQKTLILAWSLAASHVGVWTENHEAIMSHVLHNFTRLFQIILKSENTVINEFGALLNSHSSNDADRKISLVLKLYKLLVHLCNLDMVHQNLFPVTLRLTHETINVLLNNEELKQRPERFETLHGCYTLLHYTELALSRTYTHISGQVSCNSVPALLQFANTDMKAPAVMCTYSSGILRSTEENEESDPTVMTRQQDPMFWLTDNVGQKYV